MKLLNEIGFVLTSLFPKSVYFKKENLETSQNSITPVFLPETALCLISFLLLLGYTQACDVTASLLKEVLETASTTSFSPRLFSKDNAIELFITKEEKKRLVYSQMRPRCFECETE